MMVARILAIHSLSLPGSLPKSQGGNVSICSHDDAVISGWLWHTRYTAIQGPQYECNLLQAQNKIKSRAAALGLALNRSFGASMVPIPPPSSTCGSNGTPFSRALSSPEAAASKGGQSKS